MNKYAKKAIEMQIKENKNRADEGDLVSQGFLGCLYFMKEEYEEAFKYLNLAVKKGASRPMYYLGKIYENGFGVVEKDIEKAKELYEGSLPNEYMASIDLARLYKRENNVDKTIEYYKKFLKFSPDYKEVKEAQNYLDTL